MANDMQEQLTKYLTDAHSIEEMALQQLKRAKEVAGEPQFEEALRAHVPQTEDHERRVRTLLEERGASPSRLKDAVMRATGSGFVLFARVQTDTPGKLASHALSFEGLEWASYDLLARTATRAHETRVAEVALSIRDEERMMMDRIEGLLAQTAEASLEAAAGDDLEEHLRRYLADAHAIEEQSIQLLESGREMLDHPTLHRLFEEHLEESRRQQELVAERLEAIGGERSWIKDAAMRLGAFEWGMFFMGHPDTPGKLMAFAYAFEHLEIGGYEQLRHVAERVGDGETVRMVEAILDQERRAAEKLAAAFEEAVDAALVAQAD